MFFEKIRALFQWLGEKSMVRSRKALDYKWTTYRAEKDEVSGVPMNKPEAGAIAAVETPQVPEVAIDVDALFTEEKKQKRIAQKKSSSPRKAVTKSTKPVAEKPAKASKSTKKTAVKVQKPEIEQASASDIQQSLKVANTAVKTPTPRVDARKAVAKGKAQKVQESVVVEKLSVPETTVLLEVPENAAGQTLVDDSMVEQKPVVQKQTRRCSATKKVEAFGPTAEITVEKEVVVELAKKVATRSRVGKQPADAGKTASEPDKAVGRNTIKRSRSGAVESKEVVQQKELRSEGNAPDPIPSQRSRKKQVSSEERQLYEQWREMLHDRNLQGLVGRLQERFPEVATLTTKPQLLARMKANRDLAKAVTALIGVSYREGAPGARNRRGRKPQRRLVLTNAPQTPDPSQGPASKE